MKRKIFVVTGSLILFLIVRFIMLRSGQHQLLRKISDVDGVFLLTRISNAFELSYYSSEENRIEIYDENGESVPVVYEQKDKTVTVSFPEGLDKEKVYHCVLNANEYFLDEEMQQVRTLYFTCMTENELFFSDEEKRMQVLKLDLKEEYVIFQNRIQLGNLNCIIGNECISWEQEVSLSDFDCEIYLDDKLHGFSDGSLECSGVSAGNHTLRIKVVIGENELNYEKTVALSLPYDGAEDAELIRKASELLPDMYQKVYEMTWGAYYEQSYSDYVYKNDKIYFKLTDVDNMEELMDGWYEVFSRKYTIEEATGKELQYIEIGDGIYTPNEGIGSLDVEISATDIKTKKKDEVVYTGSVEDIRSGAISEIEMSLVFENHEWKYGYLKVGNVIFEPKGETEEHDEGINAIEQEAPSDYVLYISEKLAEKGLLNGNQTMIVESETTYALTVTVGTDTPEKFTVTDRYHLDKKTLKITRDLTGEEI